MYLSEDEMSHFIMVLKYQTIELDTDIILEDVLFNILSFIFGMPIKILFIILYPTTISWLNWPRGQWIISKFLNVEVDGRKRKQTKKSKLS